MSTLDPRDLALLAAARGARPTAAARVRIDAGLAMQLGAAGLLLPKLAAPAAAPPAAPPAMPPPVPVTLTGGALTGGAFTGSLAAKAIVVAALAGGLGYGGAARVAPPPRAAVTARAPLAAARPAPVSTEAAVRPPETAATSSTVPEEEPPMPPVQPALAAPRPRASAPRPALSGEAAPPAPSSTASLDDELALLRRAQRALKQGDGAEALARLDELGARHPDGVLNEERLPARVIGLCAAGRTDEAREAGHHFVAEHGDSVQVERVRASCAFNGHGGGGR